jgi:hypothetical protein
MSALDKYLDLTVFNNSFRYIGIPRTATQSIRKYLENINNNYVVIEPVKTITLVILRKPLDRLSSALRHNKDWQKLEFDDISNECQLDEHYLPFTKFDFFPKLDKTTIFLNYNKNVIQQIKIIIENNYEIKINDIEIPFINQTQQKRFFSCPYQMFINRHLKEFKKIYKNDIDFYNTLFK